MGGSVWHTVQLRGSLGHSMADCGGSRGVEVVGQIPQMTRTLQSNVMALPWKPFSNMRVDAIFLFTHCLSKCDSSLTAGWQGCISKMNHLIVSLKNQQLVTVGIQQVTTFNISQYLRYQEMNQFIIISRFSPLCTNEPWLNLWFPHDAVLISAFHVWNHPVNKEQPINSHSLKLYFHFFILVIYK